MSTPSNGGEDFFANMSFRSDSKPRNPQLVMEKGRSYLIAFESTYMNRDFYNIRDIYEQYGEWCPGKGGIQVPIDKKGELLTALNRLANNLGPNQPRVRLSAPK